VFHCFYPNKLYTRGCDPNKKNPREIIKNPFFYFEKNIKQRVFYISASLAGVAGKDEREDPTKAKAKETSELSRIPPPPPREHSTRRIGLTLSAHK
jgi:hypothetical protein